jgi:hypothetical protein
MDYTNLQHLPVTLRNIRSAATTDTVDAMSSETPDLRFHTNNPQAYQNFPVTIGDLDQRMLHAANAFGPPTSLENHHGSLGGRRHLPHQHHSQIAQQRMQQLLGSNHEETQIQIAIASSHGQMQALRSLSSPEQSISNGHGGFPASNDPLDLLSSIQQDEQNHNNTPHSNSNDSEVVNKPNTGGHFGGMKLVPHPPDLLAWRERLFNVDDIVTLTEEQ